MIETVLKVLALIARPAAHLFDYFRQTPKLSVRLKGSGSSQSLTSDHEVMRLHWWRELVLHNDSPNVIRGIKLLCFEPKTWKLAGECPTRLEPDQKHSMRMDTEIHRKRQALLDQFGEAQQRRFAEVVFPEMIVGVRIELELINSRGRKMFEYVSFTSEGSSVIELTTSRRPTAANTQKYGASDN